ncbi:hypothetical protein D9615_009509 [Tricholomella constricta]|uniref:Uncharacterized protein n=1 Tax=Tricholomella constricta TaxID=117010 RepID=A0A8H5GYL1_9AGAR|nr:hypothetical protein D9615_009509 [Tricholomella constricta]
MIGARRWECQSISALLLNSPPPPNATTKVPPFDILSLVSSPSNLGEYEPISPNKYLRRSNAHTSPPRPKNPSAAHARLVSAGEPLPHRRLLDLDVRRHAGDRTRRRPRLPRNVRPAPGPRRHRRPHPHHRRRLLHALRERRQRRRHEDAGLGRRGRGHDVWQTAQEYEVQLNPQGAVSPVVFAVRATNRADAGGGPNVAGLLMAVELALADGSTVFVMSGGEGTWRATGIIPDDFQGTGLNDSGWEVPVNLAKNGEGPWGKDVVVTPLDTVVGTTTTTQSTVSTAGITSSSSSSSLSASVTSSNTTTTSTSSGKATTTSRSTSDESSVSVTASTSSETPSITATISRSKPPLGAIVGGAAGGGAFMLLLLIGCLICYRRHRRSKGTPASSNAGAAESSKANPREGAVVPFTLQTPYDDGLRSREFYRRDEKKAGGGGGGGGGQTSEVAGVWGNNRGQENWASASSSSGGGSRAMRVSALRSRMQRLQELAEELKRALAEHTPDSPRVVALRGRIAELVRMDNEQVQ